jgi:1,4-alpha-glucan branching enzyme
MKKITLSFLFGFFSLVAFAQLKTPEWVQNATIYEVNVRQFTPEGTFAAFEKQLPRLKEMGVDILWLMPIHPIGELNRKGSLGSYYAVRDYRGINPEFGTHEDFQHLVESAHNLGMKVIIDWVANHTSRRPLDRRKETRLVHFRFTRQGSTHNRYRLVGCRRPQLRKCRNARRNDFLYGILGARLQYRWLSL